MVRRTFMRKGLLACLLFLIFLNTILSISNIIAYTASQSGSALSKNEGTAKSRFSCVVPTPRESWIHGAVTFRFRRVERVETSKQTAPEFALMQICLFLTFALNQISGVLYDNAHEFTRQ